MTELYIVRHAIAEERDASRWPDDSQRPLTADGAERFRRAAHGLRTILPSVDRVLSSPFVRAWQTAELLVSEAGWPEAEPAGELAADREPAEALPLARRAAGEAASVALVGHEPHLSALASLLLTGDENRVAIELKKGGVIALATDGDSAELRWIATPKLLRGLEG